MEGVTAIVIPGREDSKDDDAALWEVTAVVHSHLSVLLCKEKAEEGEWD